MRDRLTLPTCAGCEHRYCHEEPQAIIKKGTRLQPFERYCLGGKKPRRFRGSDSKHKAPAWCPRRKSPCELRVYGFKDADAWLIHERLCQDGGKEYYPLPYRYAVRHSQTTELSAYEFWKRLETEREDELLPVTVTLHEVLEIDDGLKPVFFYKTRRGYRIAHGFMPKTP